jgi:hypothetical protein
MSPVEINYWAEGPTDQAIARRLIRFAGGQPGADFSRRRGKVRGKDYLDGRIAAFNSGARNAPWLVLRDSDGACARDLIDRLLPKPARLMRFRIVVPSVEAWLMADAAGFSDYFRVPQKRVPGNPEALPDAKARLLHLARSSGSRVVRKGLLPHPKSGRREGPEYSTHLIEYIDSAWRPANARQNAPSLDRALRRLAELVVAVRREARS